MIEKLKIAKIYKDLDLSFTAHPVTGDVAKKLDVNAVKQSLRILMLSNFYERPFAAEKAGNIRGFLFENFSDTTSRALEFSLRNLIDTYEKRAKIEDIRVTASPNTNLLNISINFYVVGIPDTQTLSFNIERLR
jgi:phage baseplate assembly protein W